MHTPNFRVGIGFYHSYYVNCFVIQDDFVDCWVVHPRPLVRGSLGTSLESGGCVVVVVVLAMQDYYCIITQEEMKSDNNMMNDENAICIISEYNHQE